MKKFNSDYGVYCCSHVFDADKSALVVIRDPEGDWQFLCGASHEESEIRLVGVGHLLDRDPSLCFAVELDAGEGIERHSKLGEWRGFEV